MSYDITFACKKKEDFDMWMTAFDALQRETEKKKDQIIKNQLIKNIEDADESPSASAN